MIIAVGLAISVIILYYIYDAYRRSIQPSKYMLAAEKMKFIGYNASNGQRISMEQQQEALLQIFHLAGYFNLSHLWCDLNCIGKLENLENVFEEMSLAVRFSNADQLNPAKFNAKYLRKNLFKSDNIDVQDALDLILYIGQHGFNREIGQERYELVSHDGINNYADEYRQAARILRLIDREDPCLNEYDGVWIAGASRQALSQRIIDFNNYLVLRNITIHGEILVLAGERELWANIDGISPEINKKLLEASQRNIDIDTISLLPSADDRSVRINEGKPYMMNLAQFYNIKLNSSEPFIQYKSKDDCPSDRFPNRVYANYDTNETLKLTETLMSRDLLRTFLDNSASKVFIIDTLAQKQSRPNTASTARDAAERLVKRILAGDYGEKKKFVILFVSSNPYIERQTLATQRQVNLELEKYVLDAKSYQIKIEGIGYSCKESLAIVHSELAALIAEKWRIATADIEKSLGLKPKRDMKNLLFQTRDKNREPSFQQLFKQLI
jgi:hypothetical protein